MMWSRGENVVQGGVARKTDFIRRQTTGGRSGGIPRPVRSLTGRDSTYQTIMLSFSLSIVKTEDLHLLRCAKTLRISVSEGLTGRRYGTIAFLQMGSLIQSKPAQRPLSAIQLFPDVSITQGDFFVG